MLGRIHVFGVTINIELIDDERAGTKFLIPSLHIFILDSPYILMYIYVYHLTFFAAVSHFANIFNFSRWEYFFCQINRCFVRFSVFFLCLYKYNPLPTFDNIDSITVDPCYPSSGTRTTCGANHWHFDIMFENKSQRMHFESGCNRKASPLQRGWSVFLMTARKFYKIQKSEVGRNA